MSSTRSSMTSSTASARVAVAPLPLPAANRRRRFLEALEQPVELELERIAYGLTPETDGIAAAAPLFPRVDQPTARGVIDTHAHLDACAEPADELVARARRGRRPTGSSRSARASIPAVRPLRSPAGTPVSSQRLEFTRTRQRRPDATQLDESAARCSPTCARSPSARPALDFYRDYAPRDRQRELFERQLELAAELGKPVVVHTRAASEETAAALEAVFGHRRRCLLLRAELLPVALERGYIPLVRRQRHLPEGRGKLREAACAVPGERLLAETDSPYLSPQPRRGRPNEPANVIHTIAALAESRGEDATELAVGLDANASAAFGLA